MVDKAEADFQSLVGLPVVLGAEGTVVEFQAALAVDSVVVDDGGTVVE